jgi:hypothetical protein
LLCGHEIVARVGKLQNIMSRSMFQRTLIH